MARRAGVWVLGGAAAATGALLAAPDAYAWLRRRAGLAHPEVEGDPTGTADDTFDTRAARLSLRARLGETAEADAQAATVAAEQPAPPEQPERAPRGARAERPLAARPPPTRSEVEPKRKAVDEARTRMLANARKATAENGPAA